MNLIPLYEELFKKPDHTTPEHSCPRSLPFSFLAVGQIGLRYIPVFVAGTSYARFHTMPADISIEPFKAFPKEFHVSRITHMAFIACGIGHTDVKAVKIGFPVWSQHFLEGINIKTGRYLIADGTDYLVVGYGKGRIYHNPAEHLVVYVPVKMFHQLPVRESGVRLQDHKGDLRRRTEDVPASQSLFRQAHGLCHTLKRKHRMKPAKLTLMKTLAIFFYNIKFCKAQSRVNFRNILYLSHIFVGEFPPFWIPNLICGGIPKDTKKPTNSQHFVYELVG